MSGMTAFRLRRLVAERSAFHLRRVAPLRPLLVKLFAADLRNLHDAIKGTDLHGHYRVWSGLLLGWARDGAILAHDSDDADFAVADRDFDRLVAAVPAIIAAGFRPDRRFFNNAGELTEVTFMRHGTRFEFFRMFPAGDRVRYFLYSGESGELVEVEASLPAQSTEPFSFLGRSWLKSADHELELRSMYGSWQVPDPSWTYLDGLDIEDRRVWRNPGVDWRGGAAALAEALRRRAPSG